MREINTTINLAVDDDLWEVYELGRMSHGTGVAPRTGGFPRKHAHAFFKSCIDEDDKWLGVAKGPDGEVAGYLAGCVMPLFYNLDESFGHKLSWWVDPKYRGQQLGRRLIVEFEDWAKEKGAVGTMLSLVDTVYPQHSERVFKDLDYRVFQHSYTKRF